MAQPLAGYNMTYIGTVGTVTLTDRATNLIRVVIPGTYVGTVIFHDAVGTAGTTATSSRGTYGLPALLSPTNIEVGGICQKGLTYMATGTPNLIAIWE